MMKVMIHLYNNNDFFGSTHTQSQPPLFLKGSTLSELPIFTSVSSGSGIFFPCTGYAESLSNEFGCAAFNSYYSMTAWRGRDMLWHPLHHNRVTHDFALKTLLISLCLPFLFCSMSVTIQAIFQING